MSATQLKKLRSICESEHVIKLIDADIKNLKDDNKNKDASTEKKSEYKFETFRKELEEPSREEYKEIEMTEEIEEESSVYLDYCSIQ